ncbi:hypothetical protein K505DRAFT_244549, partial [Melanomma pulvis-pyrius CBS 109.77]
NVVSKLEGGLSVIRISEDVVVKCGLAATRFEACNQQRAYKILVSVIIRGSKVYRFFSNSLDTYLIIKYING